MRWKLGKYQFEAPTNVLIGPTGKKLLEPKASALLRYFLENPGRDISRDELIQSVWNGHIVTDGAINRVVVRLRRELGDESKIKHMIITVPKVGYRFVYQAIEMQTEIIESASIEQSQRYLLMILPLLIALAIWAWSTPTPPQANANITPMVRLTSAQTEATHTAQAGKLVYVQRTDKEASLYLAAQADAPAVKVGLTGKFVDTPTWSANGRYLAYRHMSNNNCTFRLIRFVEGVPKSDEAVYECRPSQTASFAFNHQTTHLYFTEQETPYAPFHAFELDIETGSTRRLSQPLANDKGNHHLDTHPVSGKVLLLHDRHPGKTSAFALDVDTNSFERLIDWSYGVDYAIWGHAPGTIVHPGEHPSYRLLETQVDDGSARILVSDSRRIKEPARIENSKDYLFTSYIYNQDVFLRDMDQASINSSVMDYLATLSRDGRRLAFISKRTGTSLIWIQNLETGNMHSINAKTSGLKLRAMDWSFDNEKLLVTTSSGLIIVNTQTSQLEKQLELENTAYGATWSVEGEITYSFNTDGRWHLFRYNLATGQTIEEDSRWAFLLNGANRQIRIDQNYQIYEQGMEILKNQCASPIRLQDLTLRLDHNTLYCISSEKPLDLVQLDGAGNTRLIENALSETRHYSVAKNRIARTDIVSIVSDIMRTNYQE
ncbi:winged helix-turn-helix domain-containing protein [Kordiimonas aquimaris]|uniref:winged helix-turn-helix domain-containing protein n=1 Tax=Kordiimonas aquimaris TaxID=707591 RepID=UPI0021D36AC9|nr:winged helix-turn-helix domain-containing protein [Kordiimonas aquimaris]